MFPHHIRLAFAFSAVWLLLGVCEPRVAANPIAIVGVDVVNPIGHDSLDNATVLLDGDQITHVGSRDEVRVPESATIIDGNGRWLIPGLMDLHVHFGQDGALTGSYKDGLPNPQDNPELFTTNQDLIAPKYAVERTFRHFARCGITTVRSLGEYDWAHRGTNTLRSRAGRVPFAPRLVLSTTAYHPRSSRPSRRRVTTPEQAVRLLRAFNEKSKPDLLKVWWVDGRFIGEADESDEWKKHQPIVKALLDEAKRLGIGNGVDAIEAPKAKEVARMGGNLVHGIFFGDIDDECIELMKANDTHVTSTLVASIRYFGTVAGHVRYTPSELLLGDPNTIAQTLDIRHGDTDRFVIPHGGSRFDGMTLTQAIWAQPYTDEIGTASKNLLRIHRAGITVGIGTDAAIPGVPFGASIFTEFDLHIAAGLTPHEILTAATINNATILDRQQQLGSIAVGKQADLVLLSADPREQIIDGQMIVGTIRGGRHFTAADLNDDTPQDVVMRLRSSFNNGSPAAMSVLMHQDVALRDSKRRLERVGRDQVLAEFWKGVDGRAHRQLIRRAAIGDTVVQTEAWPDDRIYVVRYEVVDQRVSMIQIESFNQKD